MESKETKNGAVISAEATAEIDLDDEVLLSSFVECLIVSCVPSV